MTDPLIAAARFLTAQLPWLRHATDAQGGPVAADVFREIGDCAARMRSLVDGPREQRFLGPCGAPQWVENLGGEAGCREIEGPPCEGDVYGVAGAQTGRCRTCKTEYQQADRRIWLDEQVSGSDLAWTARGIADALSISPKTVRSWATERRTESGHLLRAAKLSTYWRNPGGQLVPWVEPRQGEDVKARGDRLHYVADVTALAREAAERRAQREARTTAEMGA